ncbi:MAG: hypothetical protein QM638_02870 [Nocardioides sp.]|uniref:hypothetical protein n=1 Tax=Nocardioides sp. TaxID=35761 RepID=UPI0039E709B7
MPSHPRDVHFIEIVLADAGIQATRQEIDEYAQDRRALLLMLERMYQSPFDDPYAGPFLTPSLDS